VLFDASLTFITMLEAAQSSASKSSFRNSKEVSGQHRNAGSMKRPQTPAQIGRVARSRAGWQADVDAAERLFT